jgi:hypothetical protein
MKNTVLILIFGFLLAACYPALDIGPIGEPSQLPVIGPAPELTNSIWLNTDQPLRLSDLRGKVILLDMWTFG